MTLTLRAVGLDLSAAACGLALVDGTCCTVRPKTKPNDTARRLHEIVDRIGTRLRADRPDVAVIEGYNPGGFQGFTMARLGEVGGVVRILLYELVIPYVEIAPKSLKLFAAGSGSATKKQMINVATALGAVVANDNEADAWLLRLAALQRYEPLLTRPQLTKSISRLPWPQLTERVA